MRARWQAGLTCHRAGTGGQGPGSGEDFGGPEVVRMREKGKGPRQEDPSEASSDERPHLTLKEGDSGMRGSHGPMLVTCC